MKSKCRSHSTTKAQSKNPGKEWARKHSFLDFSLPARTEYIRAGYFLLIKQKKVTNAESAAVLPGIHPVTKS
jgi:hypothetical protein